MELTLFIGIYVVSSCMAHRRKGVQSIYVHEAGPVASMKLVSRRIARR